MNTRHKGSRHLWWGASCHCSAPKATDEMVSVGIQLSAEYLNKLLVARGPRCSFPVAGMILISHDQFEGNADICTALHLPRWDKLRKSLTRLTRHDIRQHRQGFFTWTAETSACLSWLALVGTALHLLWWEKLRKSLTWLTRHDIRQHRQDFSIWTAETSACLSWLTLVGIIHIEADVFSHLRKPG